MQSQFAELKTDRARERRNHMVPGLIAWLLGVPLIFIVIAYLIF